MEFFGEKTVCTQQNKSKNGMKTFCRVIFSAAGTGGKAKGGDGFRFQVGFREGDCLIFCAGVEKSGSIRYV